MKTSLAAQRTETFIKQGFKKHVCKGFLPKPNYFPTKMTIKLNHYHLSQKIP